MGWFFLLFFLHIFLELYQAICFTLYDIPLVERKKYIKIDRHKLKYLDWVEKINCAYCGYGNGVLNYASAIAIATEKYWCGIKHSKDQYFIEPEHHRDYLEYGDEEGYKNIK